MTPQFQVVALAGEHGGEPGDGGLRRRLAAVAAGATAGRSRLVPGKLAADVASSVCWRSLAVGRAGLCRAQFAVSSLLPKYLVPDPFTIVLLCPGAGDSVLSHASHRCRESCSTWR